MIGLESDKNHLCFKTYLLWFSVTLQYRFPVFPTPKMTLVTRRLFQPTRVTLDFSLVKVLVIQR